MTQKPGQQQDQGPDFTLAEVTKGKVALCLLKGENLHIIKDDMTSQQAIAMLRDVLTGVISPAKLSEYQWRTIKISEAGFIGAERMELPPVKDWPKRSRGETHE